MSRFNPPEYFITLMFLAFGLHMIVPVYQLINPPYTFIGIIIMLVGATLTIWTDRLFRKHQTTIKPAEDPSQLITHGPFEISRHPMYLGFVLILTGFALYLGSLAPFIGPIAMYLTAHYVFIPMEETNLHRIFGDVYREYCERVNKWFQL